MFTSVVDAEPRDVRESLSSDSSHTAARRSRTSQISAKRYGYCVRQRARCVRSRACWRGARSAMLPLCDARRATSASLGPRLRMPTVCPKAALAWSHHPIACKNGSSPHQNEARAVTHTTWQNHFLTARGFRVSSEVLAGHRLILGICALSPAIAAAMFDSLRGGRGARRQRRRRRAARPE